MKTTRFVLRIVIIMAITMCVLTFAILWLTEVNAESEYGGTKLYVTANRLNGRSRPSKKSSIEAIFDKGDELITTGQWSDNYQWIEVYGGETGTVWCKAEYLTERYSAFTVVNLNPGKIKIRSKPINGKITGYLKSNQRIDIYQSILGWGRTDKGWIDLSWLIIEE